MLKRLQPVLACLSSIVTALVLTVTTGAVSATAAKANLCSGYGSCNAMVYPDSGYGAASGNRYWGMDPGHNCTNYVAYRLIQAGIDASYLRGKGDAHLWGSVAKSHGAIVDSVPTVGSVAWWDSNAGGTGKSGHVAYVEQVGSGWIIVSEDNWLSNGTGTFHWVKYDGSSRPTGYIHFLPKANHILSDVTGDRKADSTVIYNADGAWYVAPSTGSGFGGWSRWISGHGAGSRSQFLADVTGDGRADSVVFFPSDGSWYVAPSTGRGFAGWTRWIAGHGVGSQRQLLADVTGDRKADAVVFFGGDGSWYVAPSTGNRFGGWSRWTVGHGAGSA